MIGNCSKCGRINVYIIEHHHKGYEDNNDEVIPLCQSCHVKLHHKIRKEGKRTYSPEEIKPMTIRSNQRRNYRNKRRYRFHFAQVIEAHIMLRENINYNSDNEYISYSSYFSSNKPFCVIQEETK